MDLRFRDPGLDHSLNMILEFQKPGQSGWWRDSLFHFYPQLDRARFDALSSEKQAAYLRRELEKVYAQVRGEIGEKTRTYRACWEEHRPQVEAAFSDAFGLDAGELFNDVTVNITLNPICPRYLEERSFDLFYLSSPPGALGLSLHELTHFLWFHVWQEVFGDDPAEYETPHLKWVLSEMAADPILSDPRLAAINPYYPGECVYEYFYAMEIEGKPILETLGHAWREMPVRAFMPWALEYCQAHEPEIRRQMK